MTATSTSCGHKVEWRGRRWVYSDTGDPIDYRPCAQCNRQQDKLFLKIPADLSCTGNEKWKVVEIDCCIADIVWALQIQGIDMRGSCCGHGKADGYIHLQDGRVLVIKQDGDKYLEEK